MCPVPEVVDAGLLRPEVDRRGGAVDLVELPLDSRGAGGTRHSADLQLDMPAGRVSVADFISPSSRESQGLVAVACRDRDGRFAGCRGADGHREFGGVHHAPVLEVEEQPIVAVAWKRGVETDFGAGWCAGPKAPRYGSRSVTGIPSRLTDKVGIDDSLTVVLSYSVTAYPSSAVVVLAMGNGCGS